MHNIHFITVNDGVDSANGEDDFTPFRNVMNEWYAKKTVADTVKKKRCSLFHYTSKSTNSIKAFSLIIMVFA